MLSEHVYCVAVTFKMTELVEQPICIKFCIKLEHSSTGTIQMIQKPQQLATGDWQVHQDNVPTQASRFVQSFLQNIKSPSDSIPPTAQIWLSVTSGLSQNWNHLWQGRDFRPLMRFRKISWGSWWRLGELCEVPRCLLWRGLRHHCPTYSISCIFFNKCLYFL